MVNATVNVGKEVNGVLIKRSAVRTMAKDIKSLGEEIASKRQEEFLNISKDKKQEIRKQEINIVKRETEKMLVEKEKIQNLIKKLYSDEDTFKKNIKVEQNIQKSVPRRKTFKEQAQTEEKKPNIMIDFTLPERELKNSVPKRKAQTEEKKPNIMIDFTLPERELPKTINDKIREIEAILLKLEEVKKGLEKKLVPFENNKQAILKQIERSKKDLKDIKKEEKEIEIKKQEIEEKESIAELDKKREIEKQRWSIEKQRDIIEGKRYLKEDEQKSLKLQLKEVDINADNLLNEIKKQEKEIENLRNQKNKYVLSLKKEELEKEYSSSDNLYEDSKIKLLENTDIKEEKEEELNEILKSEALIEKQVLELEENANNVIEIIEKRKLESERREKEEERKDMERKRWVIEDELEKIRQERKAVKTEYKALVEKREKLEIEIQEIDSMIKE